MSPAGLNLTGRIWDYAYNLGDGDDDIGGAVPSGTVLQERVELRIHATEPTQALLEQGIEDISMFTGVVGNYTVDILNNHQIEITLPSNSSYFGEFFRVVGNPQHASVSPSDSRGFLMVNLKRVEKARTIQ